MPGTLSLSLVPQSTNNPVFKLTYSLWTTKMSSKSIHSFLSCIQMSTTCCYYYYFGCCLTSRFSRDHSGLGQVWYLHTVTEINKWMTTCHCISLPIVVAKKPQTDILE